MTQLLTVLNELNRLVSLLQGADLSKLEADLQTAGSDAEKLAADATKFLSDLKAAFPNLQA